MKTSERGSGMNPAKIAFLPLRGDPSAAYFTTRGVESSDPELAAEGVIEVPLSPRQWAKVKEMACSALNLFTSRGSRLAAGVREGLDKVAGALEALDTQQPGAALDDLRRAEVVLLGMRRTRESDSSMDYGCRLACSHLKTALTHCVRAAVAGRDKELIRARLSLEDAAMSVLSARQRED